MLRDPLDDYVLPIVEELQRRLPPTHDEAEGEDDDRPEMRNEEETDNQIGTYSGHPILFFIFLHNIFQIFEQ